MSTDRKADGNKILNILKQCGSRGATTSMLIEETRNAAAARRVWDLQQEGHRIDKVNDGGGIYRWIYRSGPGPRPLPKPTLTQASLLDLIRRDDDSAL